MIADKTPAERIAWLRNVITDIDVTGTRPTRMLMIKELDSLAEQVVTCCPCLPTDDEEPEAAE